MRVGDEAAAWIALRDAPRIGDVAGRKLVDRFGDALAVRTADTDALAAIGCTPAVIAALRNPAALTAARCELERVDAVGARIIALTDPEYPPLLRTLGDAPLYVVAKGTPLVESPAVAIVGARRATEYGLEVARALAVGLADAGVTVVSGLARGIDGAAHEGALAGRGCTIAVLGSGVDVIYPSEHRELAARIVDTGTLLSERPIGTAPLPSHFPARNRIIAAMTQGTVVIEAAERSGSLITARLANESGREVFAVPGRVDSPLSHGAHLLIRDGATLVRGVEDVLEQIAPALRARAMGPDGTTRPAAGGLDSAAVRVLDLLAAGAATSDDLIRQSGLPAALILATLLDLELRGAARQIEGRQFQLTGRFAGVGGLL